MFRSRFVSTVVAAGLLLTAISGCQPTPATDATKPTPTTLPTKASPAASAPSTRAAAVAWADSTYGAFEPFTVTGIGGGEVVLPGNARSGFYTITWTGDHYTNEDSFPRVIGVDGNLQEGSSAPFAFDVASVAYGVNPGAGPSGKIVVGAGGEGWSITVSPISALPPLPDSGGFDAYLYDGTEREITLKSANSGRVFLSQYDGVGTIDTNRGGLDDGSSSVTLLQGPTVVNVFLESTEPWAIIGG